MPIVLDLIHPAHPARGTVAAYLLPESATLIDCGAGANLPSLEAELAANGTAIEDLEHLLLTHIHLDHAGAAGALAARNRRLQVHVHPIGVRHLADPTRLIESTRSVYGSGFEELWGRIEPVPVDRLHPIDREQVLRIPGALLAVPTPGHCRHQVAFLAADGTLYTGDAVGGAFVGAPGYVEPAAPPPDPDADDWTVTIARIRELRPERLAIAHFGVIDDAPRHLAGLEDGLRRWVARLDLDEAAFVAAANSDRATLAPAAGADFWHYASSAAWSHAGLRRWRERRSR